MKSICPFLFLIVFFLSKCGSKLRINNMKNEEESYILDDDDYKYHDDDDYYKYEYLSQISNTNKETPRDPIQKIKDKQYHELFNCVQNNKLNTIDRKIINVKNNHGYTILDTVNRQTNPKAYAFLRKLGARHAKKFDKELNDFLKKQSWVLSDTFNYLQLDIKSSLRFFISMLKDSNNRKGANKEFLKKYMLHLNSFEYKKTQISGWKDGRLKEKGNLLGDCIKSGNFNSALFAIMLAKELNVVEELINCCTDTFERTPLQNLESTLIELENKKSNKNIHLDQEGTGCSDDHIANGKKLKEKLIQHGSNLIMNFHPMSRQSLKLFKSVAKGDFKKTKDCLSKNPNIFMKDIKGNYKFFKFTEYSKSNPIQCAELVFKHIYEKSIIILEELFENYIITDQEGTIFPHSLTEVIAQYIGNFSFINVYNKENHTILDKLREGDRLYELLSKQNAVHSYEIWKQILAHNYKLNVFEYCIPKLKSERLRKSIISNNDEYFTWLLLFGCKTTIMDDLKENLQIYHDLDINGDKFGKAILQDAAIFCTPKVIELLIKAGADPNKKDKNTDMLPIELAARKNINNVPLLKKYTDFDEKTLDALLLDDIEQLNEGINTCYVCENRNCTGYGNKIWKNEGFSSNNVSMNEYESKYENEDEDENSEVEAFEEEMGFPLYSIITKQIKCRNKKCRKILKITKIRPWLTDYYMWGYDPYGEKIIICKGKIGNKEDINLLIYEFTGEYVGIVSRRLL